MISRNASTGISGMSVRSKPFTTAFHRIFFLTYFSASSIRVKTFPLMGEISINVLFSSVAKTAIFNSTGSSEENKTRPALFRWTPSSHNSFNFWSKPTLSYFIRGSLWFCIALSRNSFKDFSSTSLTVEPDCCLSQSLCFTSMIILVSSLGDISRCSSETRR